MILVFLAIHARGVVKVSFFIQELALIDAQSVNSLKMELAINVLQIVTYVQSLALATIVQLDSTPRVVNVSVFVAMVSS